MSLPQSYGPWRYPEANRLGRDERKKYIYTVKSACTQRALSGIVVGVGSGHFLPGTLLLLDNSGRGSVPSTGSERPLQPEAIAFGHARIELAQSRTPEGAA